MRENLKLVLCWHEMLKTLSQLGAPTEFYFKYLEFENSHGAYKQYLHLAYSEVLEFKSRN